jgi:signal transduction histidine kinase
LRAAPVRRAVLALAAAVAGEVAAVVLSWGRGSAWDLIVYAVFAVTSVVAGGLIGVRHPRNPVGHLFVGLGLLQAVVGDAGHAFALHAQPAASSAVDVVDLAGASTWFVASTIFVWVFLLFPDGHLPRRWAWVAWTSVPACLTVAVGWTLGDVSSSDLAVGANPFVRPGFPAGAVFGGGMVLLAATMLLSGVSIVMRLRRASGPQRQQLRWLAYAYAVHVTVLVGLGPVWESVPAVQLTDPLVRAGVSVAACVAILRYRLYEIDLIISRALLYVTLTALLAVCFVLSTLSLGILFGRGSSWPTAGATLATALAAGPLRAVMQRRIDRRFDHRRQMALDDVRSFMVDLRAGRREPEDVEEVLRRTADDAGLRLYLSGPTATRDPEDRRLGLPVVRAGVLLGEVATDATEQDLALLPRLIDEVALAIEMARLRAELRAQLAEVTESRRRIVTAAESERRRIERDLHDGAQQRLVSIGLELRNAQHKLGPNPPPAVSRSLEAAVRGLTDTINELRDMAQGIRPGVLDEGLGAALRELAGRSPLKVRVQAPLRRFAPDLETAAYFIACEALTNAVKHARATRVRILVEDRDGALAVSVTDDGVGGTTPRAGGGLEGMADRVAAYGGRWWIDSPAGRGTTVRAELPCGS